MQRKSLSSVRISYPKLDKEDIIKRIRERLGELEKKLPLLLVILFGSYAKGNYTTASDIDLLVVYRGDEIEDAYVIVKKVLNIPLLEPHVYFENEYKEMKDVIEKMTKGGLVLFQGD